MKALASAGGRILGPVFAGAFVRDGKSAARRSPAVRAWHARGHVRLAREVRAGVRCSPALFAHAAFAFRPPAFALQKLYVAEMFPRHVPDTL